LDRSSSPARQPSATPGCLMQQIESMRREHKWSASRIAFELEQAGTPVSRRPITRLRAQLGLTRRKCIDPTGATTPEPQSINAKRPGHMVHLDVKKVGRIPDGGGWRVHGEGSEKAKAVARTMGCVKKCEQSLVFFCVVPLPEGQRRLGVYPRPVPGCGNRVQSGVAFGCRTPRHIPLLQTVLVRGCETIGGNTSRSLRKRRNFPQRHYPNTRRYDPWIDEYYYRGNIREIPPTYIDFRGPNEK